MEHFESPSSTSLEIASNDSASGDWVALGQQVYGNNCSSCHQVNGSGLPTVFPPLADNPAVTDSDPSVHILSILEGVSNKVIDGVAYASPMPGFGPALSDLEVAAVVNHERSNWGNNAQLVTPDEVTALRKSP